MNHRTRLFFPSLLLLVALLGVPARLTGQTVLQQKLNRTLIEAIKKVNNQAALKALNEGADPNAKDLDKHSYATYGKTALQLALDSEILLQKSTYYQGGPFPSPDYGLVKALLDKGADVTVTQEFYTNEGTVEFTPLLVLLLYYKNSEPLALLIVEKHPPFTPSNKEGRRALSYALGSMPRLAVALLNKGVSPNTINEKWTGWIKLDGPKWEFSKVPALTCAVYADASDMSAALAAEAHIEDFMPLLKTLLAKGANINAGDALGRTALMWAAFFDKKACLRLLLAHGADVNRKDNQGNTALHYARIQKYPDDEVIKLLKQAGAKE